VPLLQYPSHFADPSDFQSHSKGIFSLETVARNVHSMQRSPTRADKKRRKQNHGKETQEVQEARSHQAVDRCYARTC